MATEEIRLIDVRDDAGFIEVEHYAVLGDGRGVALVAPDGRVDWWPVPALDSTPAFAALLDPECGGAVVLRPVDEEATCTRRYLPHTNVLETTYRTAAGRVRVTDSLNTGDAGVLPWSELARRVEGLDDLSGRVEMRLEVRPGDGLRSWQPWVEQATANKDRGPVLHAGDVILGVRCSPQIELSTTHETVSATFTVGSGERRTVGVVAAAGDPLFLCDVESVDRRLDLSAQRWRDWSAHVRWDGAGREQILRSALALKLLAMSGTGAMAAAATTSLPERLGGPKNWDYRFSWIRDAALSIDALAVLGLEEEVHRAVAWLLHAIRDHGPDVHVLYTLQGDLPDAVRQPDVPGYRGSLPVRVGNRASGQTQLGVYGDLFGTVADWVEDGHVLDVRSARELADLADRCADVWRMDDAGIWELSEARPYTSSKMNCWRALDAAARLAESGQLTGTGQRWRGEAEVVRAWVREHCWSEARGAYTFYAGSPDLDASVLLGAQVGFDVSPRMSSTIDAISGELGAGPLVYRYSGMQSEEQTFVACAYWRVHALVLVGRVDEAASLMSSLDAVATPLGLMAEMSVPRTFEATGNLPQALSHLTYIRAAACLRGARTINQEET